MRSSWIVLCLLVLLSLVATACASTPAVQPAPLPAAPEPSAELRPKPTAAATFPLQVIDDLGREIDITARPARIISLAPSVTEILFAIDAGDQVVGLTEYCDYPPDAAEGREVVGGFSPNSLSIEKIISLKPDIVFTAGGIQAPVRDALEQAGVTAIALEPVDFLGIYANISLAGQVTGHTEEAAAVVADMRARVAAVIETVASIPAEARPTVFYEVWDEPLMTAGRGTFIGQMVETAGGTNIFADLADDYPEVSAEAVIERSPDVIMGPDSHAKGLELETLKTRPGWEHLPAVQNNRIAIVDGNTVSRGGPRLAEALEDVATALYPDLSFGEGGVPQ